MAPVERYSFKEGKEQKDEDFEVEPGKSKAIPELSPANVAALCDPTDCAGRIIVSGDSRHLAVFKLKLDFRTREIIPVENPVSVDVNSDITFSGLDNVVIASEKEGCITLTSFRHSIRNEQNVLHRSFKVRDD